MKIGFSTIQFRAIGCRACGAEVSEKSEVAERIKLVVGNGRRAYLDLHVCAQHGRHASAEPLINSSEPSPTTQGRGPSRLEARHS